MLEFVRVFIKSGTVIDKPQDYIYHIVIYRDNGNQELKKKPCRKSGLITGKFDRRSESGKDLRLGRRMGISGFWLFRSEI